MDLSSEEDEEDEDDDEEYEEVDEENIGTNTKDGSVSEADGDDE